MAAPPRGALIVVEGLDRVGKTTQVARLVERLQRAGHAAEAIKFPGEGSHIPLPPLNTPAPVGMPLVPPLHIALLTRATPADRSTGTGEQIHAYLTDPGPATAYPSLAPAHPDATPTPTPAPAPDSDHVIHLLFAANRWEAAPALRARLAGGTTLVVDRYGFSGAAYSAAKRRPDLGLDWAWAPEVGLPRPDLVLFLAAAAGAEAVEGRAGWGEERYERREMQEAVRSCFEELWGRVRGIRVERVDAGRGIEEVEAEIWRSVEEVVAGSAREGPLRALEPLAPQE